MIYKPKKIFWILLALAVLPGLIVSTSIYLSNYYIEVVANWIVIGANIILFCLASQWVYSYSLHGVKLPLGIIAYIIPGLLVLISIYSSYYHTESMVNYIVIFANAMLLSSAIQWVFFLPEVELPIGVIIYWIASAIICFIIVYYEPDFYVPIDMIFYYGMCNMVIIAVFLHSLIRNR